MEKAALRARLFMRLVLFGLPIPAHPFSACTGRLHEIAADVNLGDSGGLTVFVERLLIWLGLMVLPGLVYGWVNNLLRDGHMWAMLGVFATLGIVFSGYGSAGPRTQKWLTGAMVTLFLLFLAIEVSWELSS